MTGGAGRIPKPVRMKGAPGPVRVQVPRSVPETWQGSGQPCSQGGACALTRSRLTVPTADPGVQPRPRHPLQPDDDAHPEVPSVHPAAPGTSSSPWALSSMSCRPFGAGTASPLCGAGCMGPPPAWVLRFASVVTLTPGKGSGSGLVPQDNPTSAPVASSGWGCWKWEVGAGLEVLAGWF